MVELSICGDHANPSMNVTHTESLSISVRKRWWVPGYASAVGFMAKLLFPFIGGDAATRFLKSQINFIVNKGFEFSV